MSLSVIANLRLLGAASILALAAPAAIAQTGPESQPAAGAAAKSGEKADSDSKKPAKPKPAAPSGYATEAEARAHCRGGVVWVDEHHFNHYPGSREYGKKPGAFACE
jgi:hypothetical protein